MNTAPILRMIRVNGQLGLQPPCEGTAPNSLVDSPGHIRSVHAFNKGTQPAHQVDPVCRYPWTDQKFLLPLFLIYKKYLLCAMSWTRLLSELRLAR